MKIFPKICFAQLAPTPWRYAMLPLWCFFIFTSSRGKADVTCASTVSFNWELSGQSGQKSEIHAVVFSHGPDAENAKADLLIKARRAQAEALASCRHEHETISTCVSRRYHQAREAIRTGTLSARRAVESAIAEECSAGRGTCLSTEVSPPDCRTQESLPPRTQGESSPSTDTNGTKTEQSK
jgi:hypothetical protein